MEAPLPVKKVMLRQALKRFIYSTFESIWSFGFRIAGGRNPLKGSQTFQRVGGSPKQVVIVAPHPDDETIGAGGVAALHRQNGDTVIAVIVTDGSGSRAGGLKKEEMSKQRHQEMQAAAKILDIEFRWLGLPEGEWRVQEAEKQLSPLLKNADLIYAPSCIDFHPEHLRVARVAASLVNEKHIIRAFELGVPLTSILANVVIDISSAASQKERALDAFETQSGAIYSLKRISRYRAAFYKVPVVEVFWQMTGKAYRSLVATGDWKKIANCPYRGIRSRPFSDPLAYLTGRKERRRLVQLLNAKH